MDKPRDRSLASGLLAAVIIWALVLIGLLGPPPPKAHAPANGPAACSSQAR